MYIKLLYLECYINYRKLLTFKGSDILFQRFKWDSQIDKSQIIIGYLDRFTGIQEIQFNEFKGVHEDRDGIPLHRIRYYKINEKVVWDRKERIDLLTHSGDIRHFFKNQLEIVEQNIEQNENEDNGQAEATVYHFEKGEWSRLNTRKTGSIDGYVCNLKIVTYNVLSKRNFKRGKY